MGGKNIKKYKKYQKRAVLAQAILAQDAGPTITQDDRMMTRAL